jgi:microcystin-dependent protein
MSFNINGIPAFFPTGTICPYGGTTDPSGWVICDGSATRTSTSGMYDKLVNMSFGSIASGIYTPPDLRSGTMIGKTDSTTLLGYVGSTNNNQVTLTTNQMPSHYHTSSINAHTNAHTHTYTDEYQTDSMNSGDRENDVNGFLGDAATNRTTGSVSHNHPNSVTSNQGGGSEFSILNASYIVNWIAKL